MRCDNVRSVYELSKDFSVSYDDVCSVYELSKDFSVSYDNDEVRELSDNDEVRELSDNGLQAQCVRACPTCGNVSYVPACITPHA